MRSAGYQNQRRRHGHRVEIGPVTPLDRSTAAGPWSRDMTAGGDAFSAAGSVFRAMSGIPLGLAIITAGNPMIARRAIHCHWWCLRGVISGLRASRTGNGAAMSGSPFSLLIIPGRNPARAGRTHSAHRHRFGGGYRRRNRNPLAMSGSPFGLLIIARRYPSPSYRTSIAGGRGRQASTLLGCRRQRDHSDSESTQQIKHTQPHFVCSPINNSSPPIGGSKRDLREVPYIRQNPC